MKISPLGEKGSMKFILKQRKELNIKGVKRITYSLTFSKCDVSSASNEHTANIC